MTTLAEFLLARIAEDEAVALRARDNAGSFAVPDHVVRFSPPRVLAECEAKRRIVELHEISSEVLGNATLYGCAICDCMSDDDGEYYVGRVDEVDGCATLRLLALPYSGHPDYDPDWRP